MEPARLIAKNLKLPLLFVILVAFVVAEMNVLAAIKNLHFRRMTVLGSAGGTLFLIFLAHAAIRMKLTALGCVAARFKKVSLSGFAIKNLLPKITHLLENRPTRIDKWWLQNLL